MTTTPQQEREAANRAIAELNDLSENWSVETCLKAMAEKIAGAPDEKRAEAIHALCCLSFEEGFYRAAISHGNHIIKGAD